MVDDISKGVAYTIARQKKIQNICLTQISLRKSSSLIPRNTTFKNLFFLSSLFNLLTALNVSKCVRRKGTTTPDKWPDVKATNCLAFFAAFFCPCARDTGGNEGRQCLRAVIPLPPSPPPHRKCKHINEALGLNHKINKLQNRKHMCK